MSTFSRSLIVVAALMACSAQAQMSPTPQQLYPSLFKKDSLNTNTSKDGVRSMENNTNANNGGYQIPGSSPNSPSGTGTSSGDNSGMGSSSSGIGMSGSSGSNDGGTLGSNSGGGFLPQPGGSGTGLGLPQPFSGGGIGGLAGNMGGGLGGLTGNMGGGLGGLTGNMGGGLGGILGNQGTGVSGIGQFVTGVLPIIAGASGNSNAASIAGLIGSGVSVYQQGITNADGSFNMNGLINAGNAALQAGALLTDNEKIDKAAQFGNVGAGLYNLMGNQNNGGTFASGGYNGINYGQQNGGNGQQNGNLQAVGYNQNGQPVYLMNGQYTTNPSFIQASNGTYGGMPYGATPGIVSGTTGASNVGNNNQGLLGGLAQGVSSILPSMGNVGALTNYANSTNNNGLVGMLGAVSNIPTRGFGSSLPGVPLNQTTLPPSPGNLTALTNSNPELGGMLGVLGGSNTYQTKPLPYNNNVQYGTVETGNTKPLPYNNDVQYGTVETGNTKPLPYNESSTPTVQMPSGTSSSAQNLANIGQYNPDITYGPDGATE